MLLLSLRIHHAVRVQRRHPRKDSIAFVGLIMYRRRIIGGTFDVGKKGDSSPTRSTRHMRRISADCGDSSCNGSITRLFQRRVMQI